VPQGHSEQQGLRDNPLVFDQRDHPVSHRLKEGVQRLASSRRSQSSIGDFASES
jgi:hypothetical protein